MMAAEGEDLDRMQNEYRYAVDTSIEAIRHEEALASRNHSVAQVDEWETAQFREDELRAKARAAKERCEAALRRKFVGF
jgi:hypothetical protein